MNRLLNVIVLFFITISFLSAQGVGIGTNTPDASALLDLTSTTKGVLLPRMTAAQRTAIAAPATGLQVYQTDGAKGFYYFDGVTWTLISGGGTSGWSMTGNAGINPTTNFIGTTDAQPFIAKANNEQVFRFAPNSNNTVLGYQANHSDYTGGTFNHVIGYKAGYNNVGSFGHFDGLQAGYNNAGNNNQFIGYNTGFTNTTGYSNLFVGSAAGYSNTTGFQNNFLGYQAGYSNMSGGGDQFIGYQAGFKNTTGGNNQFSGYQAGYNNTVGNYNFFQGFNAGKSNVFGQNNYFSGYQAGYSSTTSDNHFVGFKAGYNTTTGNYNQFEGDLAGYSNTTGAQNQFIGFDAGYNNTTASNNQFNGWQAGYSNTIGYNNYFAGWQAGYYNTTGSQNQFLGFQAGAHNTSGSNNFYSGFKAGLNNTTGHDNCFIGYQAGLNNANGHHNIFIGPSAGASETDSYKLYISVADVPDPLIYGDFGLDFLRFNGQTQIDNTSGYLQPLLLLKEESATYATIQFRKWNAGGYWNQSAYVDPSYQESNQMVWFANEFEAMKLFGNGNLFIWGDLTEYSDSTLKEKIQPLRNTLSALQNINGVSYNWKDKQRKGTAHEIGLLAQEVEKYFPELVHTDEKGLKSVSYTHMVPVLLEAIKEQQAEIDQLKSKQREMDEMKVKMDLIEAQLAELLKSK